MSDEWNETEITLPLDGEVVDTKIHNASGVHKEQKLKRLGSLWFYPDGSMYVYYAPTHWRKEARGE